MASTILFGVFGLGFMVFVHELGHFLAARANGVHVDVFSVGWGSKLVGFERNGTTYQISWFPLGGYCKMRGDDALRDASRLGNDAALTEPGSFYAAAVWRRITIILAGPLANLLSAFIVLTVLGLAGFWTQSPPSRVVLAADYQLGAVPAETPAAVAGLRTGDLITAIDGRAIVSFQQLRERVAGAPERSLSLLLERDGSSLATVIEPELDEETLSGRIWVYPWLEPVLEVADGSAAATAGLIDGDRLLTLNGQMIQHSIDYTQALTDLARAGQSDAALDVLVARGERQLSYSITPWKAPAGVQPQLGLSFVVPSYWLQEHGVLSALAQGAEETARTIALTIGGFRYLFRGNAQNAVAGPLRITYFVGRAASAGFEQSFGTGVVEFTRLIALISIVLFLMNLLPVPALDGGHIVLYLIELVRGRPVAPAIVHRVQTIGISLLLLLVLTVTFSDISYFVGGGG
jgi:regulator of sigma E protease